MNLIKNNKELLFFLLAVVLITLIRSTDNSVVSCMKKLPNVLLSF